MFVTAIFDALEGRDVAIMDIPGAFMQAGIDEPPPVPYLFE